MSNTILFWLILTPGVYLVLMSLITMTKSFQNAVIFKAIPFFLGLSCLFSAFKLIGVI